MRQRSESMKSYKAYSLNNLREIPQISGFSEEEIFNMTVVGSVLPFKTNNYVVDELINWNRVPHDPIFVLTFPQKEMLLPHHFDQMAEVVRSGNRAAINAAADTIRWELNPHPANQMMNIPVMGSQQLAGLQHKYRETVLFFPSQGQTCHAYCTFCFRWPQFVGMEGLRFASKEVESLIDYVRKHPEVTDVLFTGGDPLIMTVKHLSAYVDGLINAGLPNLKRIRLGTKALGYWPYRFVSDKDSEDLLRLFERVSNAGIHLSVMAHFNHQVELSTDVVKEAIRKIRATGAEIRTQSPILANINDNPFVWAKMWEEQVNLGLIPYYMFVVRDTGAQHYFSIPLVRAWEIFREAYQMVSGLSRTVRGPSMSAHPGKIQVLGVGVVNGEKVLTLRMLQGRNPDWVSRPFFAEYDDNAIWLDELRPAFGDSKFFFEDELKEMSIPDPALEE